jgi:membrane dipeptidase
MIVNTRNTRLFARLAVGLLLALYIIVAAAAANGSPQARALQARIVTLDGHLNPPANFGTAGWSILERYDPRTRSQVDCPRPAEVERDGRLWAIYTPQGGRTPAHNPAP